MSHNYFALANETLKPDTRQSYAVLALAKEQKTSNEHKEEENRQRAIANRIEYLKLLQTEGRGSEFNDLLEVLATEVLR